MQTDIDKIKTYQRTIEDLEVRLSSYGTLIDDQHVEMGDMRWKLRGARMVAAVAIACLLVVSWRYGVAPVLVVNGLECRL